ncbi:Bacterial regulatory protein, luxR family [Legionella spiritensis]|uniref:Bacterial regulatory protein, luxR family n=2 Tax=Legionella spiritensis TaxID=452 RepID=A0A0W0Z4N3_LEGSP|nr:Bacterial regulatory protein, luxR family [Legionella spiritensis]SNV37731.1 transcription regulator protein, response regulator containing CheY-like receiver domain and HTH DNA-binding domain [Legionella spiritensis]
MIEQTSIKYDRLLKKLTNPLLQYFGIHYFCYQFVSNKGDWFTLGNNPNWLLHSAEHQFFQFDPSLVRPRHYNTSSLCFPQNHQNDLFQQTLIADAIEVFDIDHSLALIEPNARGCEYYFFGAPKSHLKVLDIYLAQLRSLRQDYTHHIQTHLQPIYSHCLNHTVNLNEINPAGFNSTHNILLAGENTKPEIGFLSAIKNIPLLTAREYQCLRWYQQGLTAKQTAQRMNLSHRTIEDHFDHIKAKYGVSSKRDLLREPVVNTVMPADL